MKDNKDFAKGRLCYN